LKKLLTELQDKLEEKAILDDPNQGVVYGRLEEKATLDEPTSARLDPVPRLDAEPRGPRADKDAKRPPYAEKWWWSSPSSSSSSSSSSGSSSSSAVQCGKAAAGSRIVGGYEVYPEHSFPWQILLTVSGSMCGGSVISKNYILTAAHCVDGSYASGMSVYVGGHARGSGDVKKVSKVIEHENYNSRTYDNDIALLKLEDELTFTDEITPICLPSSDAVVGTTCTVTGWGTTSSGGNVANDLMKVSVPILANDDCGQVTNQMTDNMMCAGYSWGGYDSCQGDSGGPLACPTSDDSSVYEQHGVVSWGIGCGDSGYPGVYARVSEYTDWIEDKADYGETFYYS